MRQGGLKAFTLVELLVVIAIISILASMLLPTLENSMRQASLLSCAGNLRQHATAYDMYYSDFDSWMPFHTTNGAAYYGFLAQRTALAYANTFPYASPSYGGSDILIRYLGNSYPVWACPDIKWPDASQLARYISHGGGYGTVFPNYYMPLDAFLTHPNNGSGVWLDSWVQCATAYASAGGGQSYCRNKANAVKRPSATLVECEEFPILGGNYANGTSFIECGYSARHGGTPIGPVSGNVLFFDGHAKTSTRFGPNLPWSGNMCCFTKP